MPSHVTRSSLHSRIIAPGFRDILSCCAVTRALLCALDESGGIKGHSMTTDGGHRVPPSSRMEQGMSAKRHCRRCDAHRQTQGYMRHMGMGRQRYSFLGSVIGLLIGLHGAAAMAAGAGSAPSLPPEIFQAPPVDGVLYNRLGVGWNATMQDIQRSYRRLAVKLHPDKHGDDEELSKQFKSVVCAYETLSNVESRLQYHLYGQHPEAPVPPPPQPTYHSPRPHHYHHDHYYQQQHYQQQHYNQQHQQQQHWGWQGGAEGGGRRGALEWCVREHYGGTSFEPLIGHLPATDLVLQQQEGGSKSVEAFDHEGRIASLADHLADRLQLYVTGQVGEWERLMFEDAQRLRDDCAMGPQLLATLGYVYERCGRRGLARLTEHFSAPSPSPPFEASRGWFKTHSPFAALSGRAHRLKTYLSAMGGGMKLLLTLRKRHRDLSDPEVLPSVLEVLWRLNRVDIERSVTQACKRLLRDPQTSLSTLTARAHGLMALGRIFTAAANLTPPPNA